MAHPAPPSDWIEWTGGECPVAHGTEVDVVHRDGEAYFGHFAMVHSDESFAASDWANTGSDSDIVEYRVVSA